MWSWGEILITPIFLCARATTDLSSDDRILTVNTHTSFELGLSYRKKSLQITMLLCIEFMILLCTIRNVEHTHIHTIQANFNPKLQTFVVVYRHTTPLSCLIPTRETKGFQNRQSH